ncbi:tectonic [Scaptodrosophila lebanonensis]|uniref:Tectonic n=1 Tax=Drosophila lebanonensis TaxID=7225 RepID=A0A6J2TRD6_DROLE|nr:tectonic [Scaptodrosophila lebanonensis]
MATGRFLIYLSLLVGITQGIKIGISPTLNPNTTTATPQTSTEMPPTTLGLDLSSAGSSSSEDTFTASSLPPSKQQNTTIATASTEAPNASTDSTALATEPPQVETASPNPPVKPIARYPYYCSCDVLAGVCDLNCCCDLDCQAEALKVFNCLAMTDHPQLQLRLEDFQYTHGLPSCKINDGWLCVFRTNTKPAKQQLFSNNFDTKDYYKWPEPLRAYETTPLAQESVFYKYEQPLQLWQPETKELKIFEIPSAYESVFCQIQQPIRHLKGMRSSCRLADISQLQHNLLTLLNLTSTHRLLATPRSVQDLMEQPGESEGESVGLDIQICLHSSSDKVVCNVTDVQLDIYSRNMKLLLYHNYTHILNAKLVLKEEPSHPNELELWQDYVVEYVLGNGTDVELKPSHAEKPTSGPLGYLQGSPVLLAKLVPQNDSELPQILDYYHENAGAGHWLSLFTKQSRGGNCRRSPEKRHAAQYGVDIAKQCLLRMEGENDLLLLSKNYTDYCQRLQAEIWAQLLPQNCHNLADISQIFISQLGRPQRDKWLPLQLHYEGEDAGPPPVRGDYNEEQRTFSCRNMLLSVRYEFHVAAMTLLQGQVAHQRLVQHASLVLGERHDLEFDGGEEQVEVPLAVSVMFYDAQRKSLNGAAASIKHLLGAWVVSFSIATSFYF